MNKRFLLLWLSDELKPSETKNYYLTSRGYASKDFEQTKTNVFLTKTQINNRYAYYESFYNIYTTKAYLFKTNKKFKFEENKLGEFSNISDSSNDLTYIIYEQDLYIFEMNGNVNSIISYLVNKYLINNIYSKIKINNICETMMFYFNDNQLTINNVFIQEASKNGLLGDFKGDEFSLGEFVYKKNSNYPLLIWCRDNKVYNNYLAETTYYEFINEIKRIKEFDYNEAINELGLVKNFGGSFYYFIDNNKIKGYVVIAKESDTFIYISYLALLKQYRKTGASAKIIESLKNIANTKKKNLILTIDVPKLLKFYQEFGFKIDGMFPFF